MYCIVTGMEFATSSERDEAYGIDSPEMLRAESQAQYEEDCIAQQDEIEVAGPKFRVAFDDEILF